MPVGMLIAGWPETLNGAVNAPSSAALRNVSRGGRSLSVPIGKGLTEQVGKTQRSTSPKIEDTRSEIDAHFAATSRTSSPLPPSASQRVSGCVSDQSSTG